MRVLSLAWRVLLGLGRWREAESMPRGVRTRLAMIGLGAILAGRLCAPAPCEAQANARAADMASSAKMIYYKSRAFRIPVTIPKEAQGLVSEVRLWVSDDFGYHWKEYGRTTPERAEFPFRTSRDGEYWFAIQTVDTQGKVYPPVDDQSPEPSLRVVVDSAPPTLVLESHGRRGSQVAIRWETQDEHLVLRSLVVEFQPQGAGPLDWRSVPLREGDFRLTGAKSWDAGTSEPLRVRATVSDRAKNVRQVELLIPDGIAAAPGSVAGQSHDGNMPPPVAPISARSTARDNPFADVDQPYENGRAANARSTALDEFDSDRGNDAGESTFGPARSGTRQDPSTRRDQTLLVGNPRFPLQYQVEGSGPGGVAKVQLWVTHDGGRTWYPQPEDADKESPYTVDLGGEGTFGLWLAVQGVSGLGDAPPAPGDKPQIWVEVDSTQPVVQIDPPRVGTGRSAGKVLITWRASDPHLGQRPITLSYRTDERESDWIRIAGPIENTGQYVWAIPPGVPPRFRVRVEVADTLGHRSAAESAPILVDRTRPKGRIIGLDPSAHFGAEETRR